MDVQEALLTRRTVHLWRPDPLPAGALEDALQAAIHAPNHKHTRPWRFTVVGPETRAKLADLALEEERLKRGCEELSPEKAALTRGKVVTPAACIVLRQVLCDDEFTRNEDYASLACATLSMMLSFHGRGVSSKWTTGRVTRAAGTYALLGVDPERERICGFLYAGTPQKVPAPPKPALDALVTRLP